MMHGGSVKSQVISTWTLQSFEIEDLQRNRRPWGQNSHGLLLYTASGHMSVSINKNIEKKTDNDAQNIFDSILFYAGNFADWRKPCCRKIKK